MPICKLIVENLGWFTGFWWSFLAYSRDVSVQFIEHNTPMTDYDSSAR